MKQMTQSHSHRARLLRHLQQMGAVRTPAVANAFAAIARECFVPLFYRQERNTWQPYREANQGEHWLDLIYEDEALVTRLDSHNIPISSSSMPSIMAEMLEALNIKRGQHILEIGTGTGYNAALLSHLTGNPRLVSSIEVNEELAKAARDILHIFEHLMYWHEVYEDIRRPGKEAYHIAFDEERACLEVTTPYRTMTLRENLFL